ncbi:MAG: prepilin-type N-terminal cleavage/methylation domain-containing protein [Lachnospirales bacterium]
MDDKKHINKKKGFTLVELIVVIAIIIILAALAVPRVTKYVDDAREARRAADFASVYTAVNAGIADWQKIEGNVLEDEAIPLNGTGAVDTKSLSYYVKDVMPTGCILSSASVADNNNYWDVTIEAEDGDVKTITIKNQGYTSVNGVKPTK